MSVQSAGLKAVRRVRAARERDSRIGLQQALATQRDRDAQAEAAAARLSAESAFPSGSADAFRLHRGVLAALAEVRSEKEKLALRSHTVVVEAQGRWQQDRTGVRAVELLLERRAAERRAELARLEARELDDIAGRAWLRDQVAAASSIAAASSEGWVS